jgi:glycerol-3-phosphate dehydrogenase
MAIQNSTQPSTRAPATDGALDFRDRASLFARLEAKVFDLIIIGGGITGAGVARSAAGRGLSVALIEAADFASGTSSRSSKMIHGGLRYLAQGDVALVREASTERQVLRRIAPHLTRITPFLLPAQSLSVMIKFRAAMWVLEKLGKVPHGERHEVWSAAELADREPVAAVEGTTGAVLYNEFLTDDARLTLANVRTARAAGAEIISYAPVREIIAENGVATGVLCKGALPGENYAAVVRGRAIVNAAGPWVDAIRSLESTQEPARLSLTKGVHIVVPHARLPIERTVLMAAADKRPVFAVPRGDVTYLGTTDTHYEKQDYWPEIDEEDVRYLFESAGRTFRGDPLRMADVCSSWTGIRPLVSQLGKSPSEISRRDEVWEGPAGILSIAGGKLTAYRRMAERIVDRIVTRLAVTARPDPSQVEPLCGGDVDLVSLSAQLANRVGETRAARLCQLYGSEAEQVAGDGGDLGAEVRHAVLKEGAVCLEDYWIRRSARAWFELDAGLSALEPAAMEMASLLGWDEATRAAQVNACRNAHEQRNALFQ